MVRVFQVITVTLFLGTAFGQSAPGRAESYYHFTLGKMHQFRENHSQALAEFRKALEVDSESVGLRMEYAEALIQSGSIAEAVEFCQQTVERYPGRIEPHLLLGRIFYNARSQENMRTKAVEQFELALAIEPDHPEALQSAAELYFEQQDYEKSVETSRRLRRAAPMQLMAYYSEAQALIELKREDEAIEVLNKGLAIRDDIPNYLLLLGELQSRNGDLEAAVDTYRRGLAHGPEPRLNEGLARALVGLGRGEEAIPVLERLTAMLPHSSDLKLDLARAYRQSGNLDRAQEVLERLLSNGSSDLQVKYELASVLALKGEVDRAADLFKELLDTEGGVARHFRPLFMTNLAWLREEQKRYGDAIELLEKVIADDPDDLDPKLRLLRVYQSAGRTEDALVLSAQLQETNGSDPFVLIARGQLLASVDRVEEAVQLLQDSASASPDAELLYVAASQIYLSRDSFSNARAVVEKALEAAPTSHRLRFQLGAVMERQKDFSAAEREFRRLIDENPDYAEALNYLGYMFAEQGVRLGEALELIQRAVALEPYNGAFLDSLGWVYFKQDNLEEAETHLRKAARLEADDPVILEHLGDLFVRKGDLEEARRFYEQSISSAEKEEEANRVREKLEQLGVPAAGL